jgi:hypothetical protein
MAFKVSGTSQAHSMRVPSEIHSEVAGVASGHQPSARDRRCHALDPSGALLAPVALIGANGKGVDHTSSWKATNVYPGHLASHRPRTAYFDNMGGGPIAFLKIRHTDARLACRHGYRCPTRIPAAQVAEQLDVKAGAWLFDEQ